MAHKDKHRAKRVGDKAASSRSRRRTAVLAEALECRRLLTAQELGSLTPGNSASDTTYVPFQEVDWSVNPVSAYTFTLTSAADFSFTLNPRLPSVAGSGLPAGIASISLLDANGNTLTTINGDGRPESYSTDELKQTDTYTLEVSLSAGASVGYDLGLSVLPKDPQRVRWGTLLSPDLHDANAPAPLYPVIPVSLGTPGTASDISTSKNTWLVAHGRNASPQSSNIVDLVNGLAAAGKQVVTVDWSQGAAGAGDGDFRGEDWIPAVGEWAAETLANLGFVGNELNLAGHSWGADVVSEIARRFVQLPAEIGSQINALVALDPATDPKTDPSFYELMGELFGKVTYGTYDTDAVRLGEAVGHSWGFWGSRWGSSLVAQSASESFGISFPSLPSYPGDDEAGVLNLFHLSNAFATETTKHSGVCDLFADMVRENDTSFPDMVSAQFALDGVQNYPANSARVWPQPAPGAFGATITAEPTGTSNFYLWQPASVFYTTGSGTDFVPASQIGAITVPTTVIHLGDTLPVTVDGVWPGGPNDPFVEVDIYLDSNQQNGGLDSGDKVVGSARVQPSALLGSEQWSVAVPTTSFSIGSNTIFAIARYAEGYSQYAEATVNIQAATGGPQNLSAPTTNALGTGDSTSPGPTLPNLTPTFTWNPVSGATGYGLYVHDITTGLSGPIVFPNAQATTTSPLQGTSYTLPTGYLVAGHQYRWGMTSFDGSNESNQGAVRYFQAPGAAAVVPTTNPLGTGDTSGPGPVVSTLTPTFSWNPVNGATGYGLYVHDITTGLSGPIVFPNANAITTSPIQGPSYTLPSGYLVSGHQYRWNVTSFNGTSESDPSSRRYFQTPAAGSAELSISSISPSSFSAPSNGSSQVVTVSGTDFDASDTIDFVDPSGNAHLVTAQSLSTTQMTLGFPFAATGQWQVIVTNSSGAVAGKFSVTAAGSPQSATPAISPNGGTFTSATSVTLSDVTPNVVIHYTIDGSDPTLTSPIYSGSSFLVSSSATVKAIALGGGLAASSIASAAFAINQPTGGAIVPASNTLTILSPAGGTAFAFQVAGASSISNWSASSSDSWLTLPVTQGITFQPNVSYRFSFNATANTSPSARIATITFSVPGSAPVYVTVTQAGNPAPVIGSVTTSTHWLRPGDPVSITAAGVSAGVTSVSFYSVVGGGSSLNLASPDTTLLGTATSADSSGNWTWNLAAPAILWPAGITVYAVAFDGVYHSATEYPAPYDQFYVAPLPVASFSLNDGSTGPVAVSNLTLAFSPLVHPETSAVDVEMKDGTPVPFTLYTVNTIPYTFKLTFANPLAPGSYVVNVHAAQVVTFFSGLPLFTDQTFRFDSVAATAPSSQVTPLPIVEATPSFLVNWSGVGLNGSSIARYTIYVSDNGGAFTSWLTNTTQTSATFAGISSHSYGFYSVATDTAGHVQPTPANAQATTIATIEPPGPSLSTSSATVYVGQTVTLTANNIDQGTTVAFYLESDGTPGLQLGPQGDQVVTAGNGSPQVVTSPPTKAATYTFYALTTDGSGNQAAASAAPSTTVTVLPPGIGSLSASAASIYAGQQVTLTANSLTPGALVTTFCLESNGVPGLQTGLQGDQPLTAGNGSPQIVSLLPTKPGTYTLYACPSDAFGNQGPTGTAAPSTTVTVLPPSVASISASAPTGYAGQPVTLTANSLSPGQLFTLFYLESNGIPGLQLGQPGAQSDQVVTAGNGSPQVTTSLPTKAGTYTFYASPTDSFGNQGATGTAAPSTTVTVLLPSVASISASAPTIYAGQPVTLTATGLSAGALFTLFYLESNGVPGLQLGQPGVQGDQVVTAGNGSPQVTTSPSTKAGTYTFYALPTDSFGNQGVTGTVAPSTTVTVQPAPVAPLVTASPQSQSAAVGTDVTFTAAANGTPTPTIQWMVEASGAGSFSPLNGQTSTTLDLGPATLDESGNQYEAVFTNGIGAPATTTAATLTVTPTPAAPAVTTHPQSRSLTVGQDASFTAAASGYPAPSVQWMVETPGSGTFSPINGATAPTLDLGSATLAETGNLYEAVFQNGSGADVTTIAATLTVDPAPAAPVVTTNPSNQTLTVGQDVSFTAAASGYPAPSVQWMVQPSGSNAFVPIDGATSATLDLGAAVLGQSGNQYEAVFHNASGPDATTTAATLSVNPAPSAPAVITNPLSQSLTVGQDASFSAAASGYPTPSVQWMVEQSGSNTFVPIDGATSTTLDLGAATLAQSGNQYEAVFHNTSGADATTTAATLTVSPAPAAPAVITNPLSQSLTVGQNVSFTAAAGGYPTPSVQWLVETAGSNTFVPIDGATATTLDLGSALLAQSGNQYEAVFHNGSGPDAVTVAATLTVAPAPAAPVVTTNPLSQSLTVGQNVSFTVAASGYPTPSVQWMVKQAGSNTFVPINGATSITPDLGAGTLALSGNQYEAVFHNSSGPDATSNPATLTVNPAPAAPVIATNPQNQSATAGQTATFTASASGTPAPTVQWFSEAFGANTFLPINGATSVTLQITGTTVAQSGNLYEAVFHNSSGADATTKPATLTVNPPVSAAGVFIDAGGPATGGYVADTDSKGGNQFSTAHAIDTSAVPNAAPSAAYQSERYGNFTYSVPNLVAGKTYTVRLHFAEIYWTSAGRRLFNVSINGQQVLTNFDIFSSAGGAFKAIALSFNTIADANGTIAVVFTSLRDNAKVSAIDIVPATASSAATQIDSGGPAAGTYLADAGFSGGATFSTTRSINTSAISNPAPQSVYQSERYGNFTYKIANLVMGKTYAVRMHFAEIYWTSAGRRLFNISINKQQVLTNFDIFNTAGGAFKAIALSYNAIADSTGTIVIMFTSVRDNAKVSAIDVTPA